MLRMLPAVTERLTETLDCQQEESRFLIWTIYLWWILALLWATKLISDTHAGAESPPGLCSPGWRRGLRIRFSLVIVSFAPDFSLSSRANIIWQDAEVFSKLAHGSHKTPRAIPVGASPLPVQRIGMSARIMIGACLQTSQFQRIECVPVL